jgi:hypothetical protein
LEFVEHSKQREWPKAPAAAADAVRQQGFASSSRVVGCRALSTDSLVAALGEKLGVTVAPSQVRMTVSVYIYLQRNAVVLCGGWALCGSLAG